MHEQLYSQAAELHRAGRLPEAHALYSHILAENPADVRALESLAQIHFSTGNQAAAVDLLRRATALDPASFALQANLGIALAVSGRFAEAVAALQHALLLNPASPQITANLAQVHADHGSALYKSGRAKDAITSFRCALFLQPDHPGALNNLAIALQETGRLQEAEPLCRRAVESHPDFAEAWYNLGRILQDQNRHPRAAEAFEKTLALQPGFAQARNNLAMTLQARGMFDDAVREYQRVIAEHPDYTDAQINLGVALKEAGRVDQSVSHYRNLLSARADLPEAWWNLGLALLLCGDFQSGWPAAEARRRIPRLECDRTFPQPQWRGEPLEGRTILLHAEQGFGDAVQFVRYAPLVRRRGGRVVVLCQPALKRLFSRQPGIDQIVADSETLPPFDVHCPLLTLPLVFQTDLATIPAQVPYIEPDSALVLQWAEKLSATPNELKVGLAWAGNPRHVNDSRRSIPTSALEPLLQTPGVRFVSLQKPTPPDAPAPHLLDFTTGLTDFADTAALIANLDLVIAVDTAVAHLAGAMAKSVWLLLPSTPDWRWLLARTDSPWYPTMRLFRQPSFGDWTSVLAEVATVLGQLAPTSMSS
jgi:tetratricopeptide (TPR) repeat protein